MLLALNLAICGVIWFKVLLFKPAMEGGAMKMKLILVIGIFSVFLCAHGWAVPIDDTINISGTGALGSVEGTFNFSATINTSATITVTLKNNSLEANGGYLTAFAFNNPGGLIKDVSLTSAPGSFNTLLFSIGGDSVKASPFGRFDIGVTTKNSFEGGGAPSNGIYVGDSATFIFELAGENLLGLDASYFFNELSVPRGAGQGTQSFVARFRGFEDGGSDKVPVTHNPVPSTVYLLGTGLIGLAGFRGRKKINVS